jgi:serine/threonine-protein kinase
MATCPTCRKRYADSVTTCEVDGDGLLPNEAFSGVDIDLAEGLAVGEYRLEKKIGEGGFGCVYKAVHPLIGKAAAIKVLNRQYSSNPQMVSRFISEARAVNQIRHRNIIDIFSFGSLEDGRQYFVMELLEGMPLDGYLKQRGRLPPEDALPILRSVARALDAAHAAGIAHRDLKPENVFLSFDDEGGIFPKLLDFGIAKLLANDTATGGTGTGAAGPKTRTGTPMGTPYYMSPEQCRGKNVDKRTDIYSFGVMCHELLTGKLPFDGDDLMDLLIKQTTVQPPSMSSVCPELPASLDAPVLRMLEKDPDKRPSSLTAAVDELTRAAKDGGFPVVLPMPAAGRSTPSMERMSSSEVAKLAEARTIEGTPNLPLQTFHGGVATASEVAPKSGTRSFVLAGVVVGALAIGGVVAFAVVGRAGGGKVAGADTAMGSSSGLASGLGSGAGSATVTIPSAVATEVAPPVQGDVEVKVIATPKNATIWLGDTKLAVAPGRVKVKGGTEKVTLTLKADGFTSATVDIMPTESSTVSNVKLTRGGGGARPKPTTGAAGEIEDPFAK